MNVPPRLQARGSVNTGTTDMAGGMDVSGPPDAPAMVFLHGVTANRKIWVPHTQLLAGRYRVIALDLPGHGALSGMPFQLDTAMDLLQRTILTEAGGKALVVGDSLGGYVAMSFAGQHPELLSGLVIASCTLEIRGPVGALAWLGGHLLSLGMSRRRVERVLVRMAERELRGRVSPAIAGPILEAGVRIGARPEAFWQLAGRDFKRILSGYPGPVLILNGERDLAFRLGERGFLAATRNARLRVIRRAGHIASLERPGVFSEAIRDFAGSIGW
jgi:pimeloyl-ACP methyl ester carboxylesterase